MKKCTNCRVEKTSDGFYLEKKRGYYHSICKVCENAKNSTPERKQYHRTWHLKSKFGLALEQYDQILLKQNNKCAICGSTDPKSNGGRFQVDHDHKTGKIRGLLCYPCNAGLGYFYDSMLNLSKAMMYLNS